MYKKPHVVRCRGNYINISVNKFALNLNIYFDLGHNIIRKSGYFGLLNGVEGTEESYEIYE